MLHEATISRSTLELLISLMNDEVMKDFVLVGGTSFALRLGHRISVDLALFSKNTIKGEVRGVQLDREIIISCSQKSVGVIEVVKRRQRRFLKLRNERKFCNFERFILFLWKHLG